MGVIILGYGAASIYNFNDNSFYSKEGYVLLLFAGLMTSGLATAALCEMRRHDQRAVNKIFMYWCIMSVIMILNMAGFYYFRIFFGNAEEPQGDISSVVKNEVQKEFQDLVMSAYTSCCTGCDTGIPTLGCKDNIALPDGVCTDVDPAGTVNSTAQCVYAVACDGSEADFGIGTGCYASATEIPSTTFGSDSCKTLTTDYFAVDGKPLVGDPSNGFSCGAGSPQTWLSNVNDYILSYKTRVLAAWGFFIVICFIAWISAMMMILCPQLRRNSK